MILSDHHFLFASLDSKRPVTVRKVHIRRLYDILELCILRNDFVRAKQAWAILVRCKEFRWEEHWRTALHVFNEGKPLTANIPERIELLRSMMFRDVDKEATLKELVLLLILSSQYRQALDELELYLPSFPYQDNPVLHIYAGLLCLQLAQGQNDTQVPDTSLLRDAQSHLNHVKSIDSLDAVAGVFLQKIHALQRRTNENELIDSDTESMRIDTSVHQHKRFKFRST